MVGTLFSFLPLSSLVQGSIRFLPTQELRSPHQLEVSDVKGVHLSLLEFLSTKLSQADIRCYEIWVVFIVNLVFTLQQGYL